MKTSMAFMKRRPLLSMNTLMSTRSRRAGCHLLITLLVSLSFIGMPARTAGAASIPVTTTADEVIDNGLCSLREALRSANLDQAIGGCPAGTGADTISLPAGSYALSLAGRDEDGGLTGDLDITSDIILIGADASTTRITGNIDRVFELHGSITVQLAQVSIQEGVTQGATGAGILNHTATLTIKGSSIINNDSSDPNAPFPGVGTGGGVHNEAGTVTVEDSTIHGNAASGIENGGTLTLINSRVESNSRRSPGGGIFNTGTLVVRGSHIDTNLARNGCGGVLNTGTATISDSTINDNRSFTIPGICNDGTLSLTNSQVNQNAADYTIGGISNTGRLTLVGTTVSNNSAMTAAGIWNNGSLAIDNSTISKNLSSTGSPGVSNQATGTITLTNVTIADSSLENTSGGTIVARNTILGVMTDPGVGPMPCAGTLTSHGYNLIQDTSGCTITGNTTGNLVGVAPRLGPLQNNGGSTSTHVLLPGSPAIDAGNPAVPGSGGTACLARDQRGVIRPQDGNGDGSARCDIGAVELERSSSAQGLTGAYYDTLTFTALKRTRVDPTVNFDWGYGSPDGAIDSSTFAVRWTGQLIPRFSERYTFFTQNDDGVRLWINNQLVIDDWRDHGVSEHQGTISLQAGVPVSIRLDYYENHGQAAVKLLWASSSQPKEIIPAEQLRPAPGLIGSYYQNQDFTNLVLSRQDATIAFDWGYGSPDEAIENSTFAVRWTGQLVPRFSERYIFFTQNDDGVRLWVNDQLVIDDWQDHGLSEHQGTIGLQAGVPVTIRLDYYENQGQAAVRLLWASPSQPKQIIPASQLMPPQ